MSQNIRRVYGFDKAQFFKHFCTLYDTGGVTIWSSRVGEKISLSLVNNTQRISVFAEIDTHVMTASRRLKYQS